MENALRPLAADRITFYGHTLTAARLSDGRVATAFNDLCAAIGLAMSAQLRRVRADDVLAEQLVTALIDDGAGERPTNVLTAWAIPLWLTGIQASR
ncbi:MAG TPA: phage antirepressor N-terminal domain-containing protein, partial [Ktedonobacterales bacterium]|nr:phage antirepressor N-terminal domain-containing protein [Ktedonobacterales bacterium]